MTSHSKIKFNEDTLTDEFSQNLVIKPGVLDGGKTVPALVYRVDRQSPQYASGLTPEEEATIVSKASGGSGHNVDYVSNTVDAMRQVGIRDRRLERVSALIRN